MLDHLIIDGYNVLHAWHEGARHRTVPGTNLQLARQSFLRDLELAAALRGVRCTVVFDGAPIEDVTYCSSEHLTVIFAGPRESADTVIERLVCKAKELSPKGTAARTKGLSPTTDPAGRPKGTVPGIVVVTNDRAQGNLIVGWGARCWSSRMLAAWLHEPPT